MIKHYDIQIWGQVQGVYFRANAKQAAEVLGITGWIKNEADGSVLMEAEGDEGSLEHFVGWCKQGSSEAQVDRVKAKESEFKNFSGFNIIG